MCVGASRPGGGCGQRPPIRRVGRVLSPDRGRGPPRFTGGPALAAPAPPSPPCSGLLRKRVGEGDLEGTRSYFPSGTTARRAASFGPTRSGGRRGFAGRRGRREGLQAALGPAAAGGEPLSGPGARWQPGDGD